MEAEESRPDLGTPERNALRDRLLACNAPQLAEAYASTVRLLHEPDFPARRTLLAHLVRDIANGLPEVVTGDKIMRFNTTKALDELAEAWRHEVQEPSAFVATEAPPEPVVTVSPTLAAQVSRLVSDHERVSLNRRDEFALLMEALRPGSKALRPALEPIIREWIDLVRWFTGQAHVPRKPAAPPDEAEMERRFRRFEDGLRGILAGHFEVTHEIDAILESSPPGAETLKRLSGLLGGREQLKYFFERIEDPAWLDPLEQNGFFKEAPGAVVDESDAGRSIWYPDWPAGPYLLRMAAVSEAQEAVARIAAQVRTENIRVHDHISEIALRLPPPLAARLVPSLTRGLCTGLRRWLPETFGVLAEKLALGGERAAAQHLLQALVEVVPDPTKETAPFSPTPRTRVNHHALARLFERHLPGIVSELRLDALEIMSDALATATQISVRGEPNESIEDHSYIWRPAIEQDGRSDSRDVLVTAVRLAARQLAEDFSRLPAVLRVLARRRWLVFRRIELHVLATLLSPPPDLVAARLLDRTLFDHFTTCREYRMLLQQGFGLLSGEQQRNWLGWVEAGLPTEQVREYLERWSESAATVDAIAKEQREWQWRWLGPAADSLPPPWRGRFHALVQEFGPPEPPSQVEETGRVYVGWESPLTLDQVRGMSVAELAAFCRTWKQSETHWRECPEGLREQLVTVVAEAPQAYANEAIAFTGLPPTYVRGLLGGFAQAVSAKRPFSWDQVLQLAAWAIAQRVDEREPAEHHREDPDWGLTRATVTRLLDEALRQDPTPLPADARWVLWSLLEVLCEEPSPQDRGAALEASVRYAEWVHGQAGRPWYGVGTLDDAPEVRTVLDKAIDLSLSPAPGVYEAIGHQLPWLIFMDEAWVQAHMHQIFPAGSAHAELWHAAWRGYLHSGFPLRERVFIVLSDVYAEAIRRLRSTNDETSRAHTPERMLAQQLVAFYGSGTLERQGHLALLDRFFERADIGLRRYFFSCIPDSLRQDSATSSEILARFQMLWDKHRVVATSAELRDFGLWFGVSGFDADWLLGQLAFVLGRPDGIDYDDLVVERLAELVELRTATTIQCFRNMVYNLRDAGVVHGWRDSVKTILATALRSGDPAAQAQAIETFHRLGSLGFRAHELLPFSNDLDDPATIAYFTWDHPMTVAEIRNRLTKASEPERNRMLGQILREAKDTDVWKFTTPEEVAQRWPQVERHLGRRRAFWTSLLGAWKEQGLLAE